MKNLWSKLQFDGRQIALILGVFVVFTTLSYFSVARYRGYNTGMQDIGNMSQAIWSATQGQPLIFTSNHGPLSRLALHVEVIYFILAPMYALFPSPITLLVIQALLFVIAAFPLYSMASRNLKSSWAALTVAGVYLFYPVAQTAVLFDFHGDTLAMPLLIFALEALDSKAWRRYTLFLLLSLLCKFYVAVPVSALGVMLWLKGRRRVGAFTLTAGLVWGSVAYFLIRPMFLPVTETSLQQATGRGYFVFYFGELFSSLPASWMARSLVALIVFLPVSWPLFYAPEWWFPALSIGLPALLSSGPGPSYYYGHHHYALVVPFAVTGAMYGVTTLKRRSCDACGQSRRFVVWPLTLGTTFILTMTFNSFFIDMPLNPQFWKPSTGALVDSMQYGRTSRDAMKDLWLEANVPEGVPLGASNFIASHLINRSTVYVPRYSFDYADEVDYVIADALFDFAESLGPTRLAGGVMYDWETIERMLRHPDFSLVAAQDGLLLFARNANSSQTLAQGVYTYPVDESAESVATFAEQIGLIEYEAGFSSERQLSFRWCWLPLDSLHDEPPLFAVSRLEGVINERFVHLPTAVLLPTPTWEQNQVVCETFEVTVSPQIPAGDYPLWVGWYNSEHLFAFATDERSRVGQEIRVGTLRVP